LTVISYRIGLSFVETRRNTNGHAIVLILFISSVCGYLYIAISIVLFSYLSDGEDT